MNDALAPAAWRCSPRSFAQKAPNESQTPAQPS